MPLEVGQFVSLKIQKVDMAYIAIRNLFGKIMDKSGKNLVIQTEYGTSDSSIPENQVSQWTADTANFADALSTKITLIHAFRSAAGFTQGSTAFLRSICNCNTGCKMKRCAYQKANVLCCCKSHKNTEEFKQKIS